MGDTAARPSMSDGERERDGDVVVLVSVMLELIAFMTLVTGLQQSMVRLVYASIGGSAVVGVMLVTWVVRSRSSAVEEAVVAPLPEPAPAPSQPEPAPAANGPDPTDAPASPLPAATPKVSSRPRVPWPSEPIGGLLAPGPALLGRLRRQPQVHADAGRPQPGSPTGPAPAEAGIDGAAAPAPGLAFSGAANAKATAGPARAKDAPRKARTASRPTGPRAIGDDVAKRAPTGKRAAAPGAQPAAPNSGRRAAQAGRAAQEVAAK